ncbi:uncharacterized protein LOC141680884 [Apium graveolens]|uniref:uncharacterized protein LOC141680884 n=1 Tax=Apium graveolens TaxID=4045 RepID=UPI003D7B2FC5
MGDTIFTWYSKKQPIVSLSTCEAEYVAASYCVCHAIWLRRLLSELRIPQQASTEIRVDNKSAIELAKNPIADVLTKPLSKNFLDTYKRFFWNKNVDSKAVHHLPLSGEEVDIKKPNEKDSFDVDHAVCTKPKPNTKEEKKVIPPREQRLEWYISTYKNKDKLLADDEEDIEPDGTHSMTFRDLASFQLDLFESDGFDVQEDHKKVNDAGLIRTYYYPEKGISPSARYVPPIMECARQAIEKYNADNGTHFDHENVIRTNVELASPYRFYITFDAVDGTRGTKENFQAIVNFHFPTTDRTVKMVRLSQPPRYFLLEDIPKVLDSPPLNITMESSSVLRRTNMSTILGG